MAGETALAENIWDISISSHSLFYVSTKIANHLQSHFSSLVASLLGPMLSFCLPVCFLVGLLVCLVVYLSVCLHLQTKTLFCHTDALFMYIFRHQCFMDSQDLRNDSSISFLVRSEVHKVSKVVAAAVKLLTGSGN